MSYNTTHEITGINGAFIAGMILGWASRLENPESIKDVINDMNKFSKELAVKSGVTLWDKNGN